ncbi:MAG: hypothetical protein J0H25_08565 [Rhizobiales bacterium]|nr:hypothetical protein [Hyphomicrobiales bacterium]
MSAERSPKLPNSQRMLPTVSFSLPQSQLDRLREIAYARDVSLSRVAREALDVAFRSWDAAAMAGEAQKPHGSSVDQGDGRAVHSLARWPRQLRRDAAKGRGIPRLDHAPFGD